MPTGRKKAFSILQNTMIMAICTFLKNIKVQKWSFPFAENTPQNPARNPYKTSIKIIIMAFSSQSLTVPMGKEKACAVNSH